jgi:hypothetical protein
MKPILYSWMGNKIYIEGICKCGNGNKRLDITCSVNLKYFINIINSMTTEFRFIDYLVSLLAVLI